MKNKSDNVSVIGFEYGLPNPLKAKTLRHLIHLRVLWYHSHSEIKILLTDF